MRTFRVTAALVALVALVASNVAANTLEYRDPTGGVPASTDGPEKVMILSAGASTTVSYFFTGEEIKSTRMTYSKHADFPDDPDCAAIFDAPTITVAKAGAAMNITAAVNAAGDVGTCQATLAVETVTAVVVKIVAVFRVSGFVLLDGRTIVSGDEGTGITVGDSGTLKYAVRARGVDGKVPDISSTTMTFNENTGVYMKEVKTSTIDSSYFTMTLNEGRVGSGSFQCLFSNTGITYDGESFETILFIKQKIDQVPACYVIGDNYKLSSGTVKLKMYNLEVPPRAKPVSTIILSINGKTFSYLKDGSTRTLPDQVIAFRPDVTGSATVTCDGTAAVIVGNGGKVTISGDVPTAPTDALATTTIESLREKDGSHILTATVVFVESDPDLLTVTENNKVMARVCLAAACTGIKTEAITRGSAYVQYAMYVDENSAEKSKGDLEECFKTEKCQKETGYTKDTLKLKSTAVKNNALGPSFTVGAGLATWTIVLIAVVGAFAILLLIMLALWAVYRRNAEQSESDYSSSGPLGVPDPSDLLYEQSIVRDIYGRGDFPDGGPSAAVAAERAREADLREEFPRPPSSSDVSRGAQTDDASSTYSV